MTTLKQVDRFIARAEREKNDKIVEYLTLIVQEAVDNAHAKQPALRDVIFGYGTYLIHVDEPTATRPTRCQPEWWIHLEELCRRLGSVGGPKKGVIKPSKKRKAK